MCINKAEYISDYILRVETDNNQSKLIDLEDFVLKSSHPLINKYKDKNLFKQFHIDDCGVICWGDNDFDINPISIIEGDFDL